MKNAPAGCLKSQKKAGKTYYYHQFMDEQSNQEMRMYIKKNNRELAEKLAQKGYLLHIRPILKNNLRALTEFEEKYDESAMEKVYDELNDERKSLVKTIDTSVNEKIRMWNEEEYEPNVSYPEMLKFETERGEMVRSKSELIIANLLLKHKKDILYKYERPLKMMIDGREETIYPDFTMPDVLLLPEIARLYEITIDDLFKTSNYAYKSYADRLGSIYERTRILLGKITSCRTTN